MTSNALCAVPNQVFGASTYTVNQNVSPSVSIQSNPTSPTCEGIPLTFTATPVNSGGSPLYEWSTNGSTWVSGGVTFQPILTIGTYQIFVRLTSNALCAFPTTVTSSPFTMEITEFIPVDLFIKDNDVFGHDDLGLQPNPDNGAMWVSNDIWTRRIQGPGGGIQEDPEYSTANPNWAYVTVRNRGCLNYSSGALLHLYWAKASTALTWPDYWNGSQTMTCSGITLELGNELPFPASPQVIGAIGAKQAIPSPVEFEWWVPNPDDFLGCFPVEYKHFCLLARIEYVDDPIGVEVPHQYTITKEFNNIAWKNLSVVNDFPGIVNNNECFSDRQVGGVVAIGNPFDTDDIYDFDFKVDENYVGKPIFEQAEIKISLDEKAWDKWIAGGSQAENIAIKREDCRQLVVKGSPARLKNLSYSAKERSLISLSFNFLTKEVDATPQFNYHVVQVRSAEDHEIIGGEMYRIGKPNRYLFGANAGGDKDVSLKDSVQLQANNIGEAAFYNWYDLAGNLVFSGPTMTVAPDFTTKYKLEVIAVSDGFTSYDSVIVHVKEYEIINLNPNPTSGQLTVEYEARNATSGYFSIVQPYTAVSNNYMLDVTQTTTSLNLSGYTPGSYFVRLICDGQIRDEKTIIIIP